MQKTLSLIASVMLVFVSGVAGFQTEDFSSPKLRISWDEFKTLHDKKDAVIVDVRSAEAYETGHIPGSRSLPLDQVEQHADELKKLKKPIVVYCA